MPRRYIDTELFDDEWFMDLSGDSKILFMYYITKCSHAGLLRINERLCNVQTGISDIGGALEGLRSRLREPKEGLFFMPKFLFYQYPKFPQSNVYQQRAALDELTRLGLFKDGELAPEKGLFSPNVNVDVNVEVMGESEGVKSEPYKDLFHSVSENLDIPDGYAEIILTWLKYKSEKGQSYKRTGLESFIKKLVVDTKRIPKTAKTWIEYSMSNNYSGVFAPKSTVSPIFSPPHPSHIEDDYDPIEELNSNKS